MQAFFLGLIPIILTAILTTVGTWWIAKSGATTARETVSDERKRHARYLAIRVVCVLDEFATACGDVVGDDGANDQDGFRRTRETTPVLCYPVDVDWKSIDPDLMYGLLSFPNQIAKSNRDIQWVWDNNNCPPDNDEVFEIRIRLYAEIGLQAVHLMEQLQERYEIVPRPDRAWSTREYIEDSVRRSNEAQSRFQPETPLVRDGLPSSFPI